MQSVGQKLRQAREAQGRSLDHIHSATRISLRTLEAIEADDIDSISSAFLYKSFVRQIAAELGVNYLELEPGVKAAVDTIPAPLMPGEGGLPPPNVPALRFGRKRNPKLIYALSSFAIVLVACSGFYALWQTAKPTTAKPASVQETPGQKSAQPGASASPDLSQNSGFTLALSATEPAWLSIIADGKQSFKGILERAETKTLEGHRTARIKTGNAGVVKVVFNGRALGALGPVGQARTVLFTKNRYQVIAEPMHVSWHAPDRSKKLVVIQSAALRPLALLPASPAPFAVAASDAPMQ